MMKPKKISALFNATMTHPKIATIVMGMLVTLVAVVLSGSLFPHEVFASPTLPLPPPAHWMKFE
jgi:hypothetical protein